MAIITKRRGEIVTASITWNYVGPRIEKLRVSCFFVKRDAANAKVSAVGESGGETGWFVHQASDSPTTRYGPVTITISTSALVAGNTFGAELQFREDAAPPIIAYFTIADALQITPGGFFGPIIT